MPLTFLRSRLGVAVLSLSVLLASTLITARLLAPAPALGRPCDLRSGSAVAQAADGRVLMCTDTRTWRTP
jgi:hypothetical protein